MMNKTYLNLFTLMLSLMIINSVYGQTTITISSNSTEGKDAIVKDVLPNNNFGSSTEFPISAWTFNGNPMITRGFIDFDFSQIPTGSTITLANLFLYNNSDALISDGEHSQLSGSNEMFVQRVIESWDEQLVSWSNQPEVSILNKVSVPASLKKNENYKIDVTSLVQNIIDNPLNSFGFSLELQTEQFFRSVVFASSNISDTTLHPKIEISYMNSTGVNDENILGDNISIFPNPTSDWITFKTPNTLKDLLVVIYNVNGQELLKQQIKDNETHIDISSFAKGIYFVDFIIDNKKEVRKIIKL
ncbi:MAG: DNRLRE domain-containing protein [Bacteroidales bacterium]|nr:DNRLRE domain-containing protein [Bacteroidales bacterium]